ncbi:MAG TPA: hypothetical protein VGG28_16080 [Kofleriaceae bacterium]|jgi:hypothetical protein
MRMVCFVVVLGTACKGNPPSPSVGSGSAPAPVVVAGDAAAAVAAGSAATQFDVDCTPVPPASLRCTIAPGDGAMPAKTCFRGILAVYNLPAHDADFVTSEQACTTADVARGGSAQLDLPLAKTDLKARCPAPASCDANAVVATSDVTAATTEWRKRIHDELVQADADTKPASSDEADAASHHLFDLCIAANAKTYPDKSADEIKALVLNGGGCNDGIDTTKLTAGMARCIGDASDDDALDKCKTAEPLVAAYAALHAGSGN